VLSAVVFLISGITKFTAGAWVSLVIIVGFSASALLIRRYYLSVGRAVALGSASKNGGVESEDVPEQIANLVIVPLATLNLASMRALAYAASSGQPVLALHISPTDDDARRFRDYWTAWGDRVPLEVVSSPYRAVVAPTIAYIEALHAKRSDLTLTVVVPELTVRHWWQRSLHEHTSRRIRRALEPLPGIVVKSVRFQLPS
jgi:hypothetical protein